MLTKLFPPPPMEDSKDLHEESPFCSPLFYLCVLCVRDSQSEQHNEGVLRQGERKKILGGIEFCVYEVNTAVLLLWEIQLHLRVCAVQSNPFPLLWEIERELGNSCKKKNSNCGSSGKVSVNETYRGVYICYRGNALGEGD